MLKPEDMCTVMNRSSGSVIYRIEDRHIRREFNARETKRVPYQEILEVAQQPGGRDLIGNYFLIKEDGAAEQALNIKPEPEYYMDPDQISKWLPTCSLAELQDALDFAPQGVKDLIKQFAVSLPLNDVAKREAIKTQLGFDVTKALALNAESKASDSDVKPSRRVQPITATEEAAPTRRVIASNS